jgi:heme o synthase
MLPVVAGRDATRTQILAYTLILVPVGLLPALLGFAGPAYGLAALITGGGMIHLAFRLYRRHAGEATDTKATDLAAKKLFAFSILYLTILFGVLLAERVVALILSQVAA